MPAESGRWGAGIKRREKEEDRLMRKMKDNEVWRIEKKRKSIKNG